MKFGIRTPSIKRRISARTTGTLKRTIKRKVVPGYGKKGMGCIKNPKRTLYVKVYNKTTVSADSLPKQKRERKVGIDDSDGTVCFLSALIFIVFTWLKIKGIL